MLQRSGKTSDREASDIQARAQGKTTMSREMADRRALKGVSESGNLFITSSANGKFCLFIASRIDVPSLRGGLKEISFIPFSTSLNFG